MIAGLLTVAVLVLVVTAIPFLRKFLVTRLRSLFAGSCRACSTSSSGP